MRKAVVTGASGFIGAALVSALAAKGVEVIALCRQNSQYDFGAHTVVYPFDLNAPLEALDHIPDRDCDVFFHLAWIGGASGESLKSMEIQQQNMISAVQTVQLAANLNCKKYIGAGSLWELELQHQFDQHASLPEKYRYGVAKLASRYLTAIECEKLHMTHIWPIIANAYGAGEKPGRFISTLVRRCLANEPSIDFTTATQNYNFLYLTDVVAAFISLGESPVAKGVYSISSQDTRALYQFIEEIKTMCGAQTHLCFGALAQSGVALPRECFDCTALMRDTGFIPQISFSQGIQKMIDWLHKEKSYGNL